MLTLWENLGHLTHFEIVAQFRHFILINEVIRLTIPRVLEQIGVHGLLLIDFEELVGVDFSAHEKLLAPLVDFSEWSHLVNQLQDRGEKLKMGVEGEVKVGPGLQ